MQVLRVKELVNCLDFYTSSPNQYSTKCMETSKENVYIYIMCSSRKYPYPPPTEGIGNSRERGVLKGPKI